MVGKMDNSYVLALRYRDLKHPTGCQNFGDAPGQTPKLILTLCPIKLLASYIGWESRKTGHKPIEGQRDNFRGKLSVSSFQYWV